MAIDEKELQEMKEYRDPLTEKLAELEEEGYKADFKLEGGKLKVVDGDQSFSADELTINKDFRFEGESNPTICPFYTPSRRRTAPKARWCTFTAPEPTMR